MLLGRGSAAALVACLGVAVVPGAVAGPSAAVAAAGVIVAGVTNSLGDGPGQLSSYPGQIAVDASGSLYVAEGDRVTKWAPGATDGVIVAGGNGTGSTPNKIGLATDVAVDSLGRVYVADSQNHRIVRWAPGAASGVVVAGGHGAGASTNQLHEPLGVTVDSAGNVYVADTGNHRVMRWAPGAASGVIVAGGAFGSGLSQLKYPVSVAVDSGRRVFVVDRVNQRVMRWAPGATAGVRVAGGSQGGSGSGQLSYPMQVVLDPAGSLYIADTFNHRVVRWAQGASSGLTVAGGQLGAGLGQLNQPEGVALDAQGRVYVSDSGGARVVRWNQPPLPPRGVVARPGLTTTTTGPLVVSFTPPAGGGQSITGYTVVCTSSNGGATRSAQGTSSPITVTGNTTGSTYTCRVSARNSLGNGLRSAASAEVIVGSPAAPTLTGVSRPSASQLRVSFTPNSANGSPITGFTATCVSSNGGVARSRSTANTSARVVTVSSLTSGKTYTCTVRATSVRGSGPESNRSVALLA